MVFYRNQFQLGTLLFQFTKNQIMPTPADFFISGVWLSSDNTNVTDVLLHSVNNRLEFSKGIKTSEENVIDLLDDGKLIRTIAWNYVSASWKERVNVIVQQNGMTRSIRAFPDTLLLDNMLHLIRMNNLM